MRLPMGLLFEPPILTDDTIFYRQVFIEGYKNKSAKPAGL